MWYRNVSSWVLALSLCMIGEGIVAQEKSQPDESIHQVSLVTKGSAQYRFFTMENPTRLVVHFESENVFSNVIQETEEFSEGILESMKTVYYPKPEGGARSPIRDLVLRFRTPASYQVIEDGQILSILLRESTASEGGKSLEQLAITRVIPGPKDLIEEEKALINAFAQAKARQIVELKRSQAKELIATVAQGGSEKRGSFQIVGAILWMTALLLVLLLGTVVWRYWSLGNLIKNQQIIKTQELALAIMKDQVQQEVQMRQKLERETQTLHERLKEMQWELVKQNDETKTIMVQSHAERGTEDGFTPTQELVGVRERRQFPRLDLKEQENGGVLVRVQAPPHPATHIGGSHVGTSFFDSEVLDLSSGGFCVQVPNGWEWPEAVSMLFYFFGQPRAVKLRGKKIWENNLGEGKAFAGISFDLNQKVEAIGQYVAERITGDRHGKEAAPEKTTA